MRRGTGCIRRREAFGWGPYPIAATEGRATEGEAGSRATSFGRGKEAECVVEPDAFVKRGIRMGPLPHRGHRGPRYRMDLTRFCGHLRRVEAYIARRFTWTGRSSDERTRRSSKPRW